MILLLPLNQQKIRFQKTVIYFTKTYVLKCLIIKFQAELQDSKKKEAWKRKPFIDKLIVYCFRLVINVLITLLLGISLAAIYKVTEKMMEVCSIQNRFACSCHQVAEKLSLSHVCPSVCMSVCLSMPHLVSLICRKTPVNLSWKQGHLCSMDTFFHIFPCHWLYYFL